MQTAVKFDNVTKSFGAKKAVDALSLEVGEGEVLCLLGPNGAGKSTSINMMLGLSRPDSGKVILYGKDPASDGAREKIGTTPQDTDFPANLTAREIIAFVSAHYPDPMKMSSIVEAFQLSAIIDRQTGGFSGGERRRLALALAFCGNGRTIFLDEPTTGLDKTARDGFWDYASDYAKSGAGFVITTHHLHEIENIATRICLIVDGRIALEGSAFEIRARVERRHVRFFAESPPNLNGYSPVLQEDGRYAVTTGNADGLVRELVRNNTDFSALEVSTCSLEEALDDFMVSQGETSS